MSGTGVVRYSWKALADYHLYGRLCVARRAVLAGVSVKFLVLGVLFACGMWQGVEVSPVFLVFRGC